METLFIETSHLFVKIGLQMVCASSTSSFRQLFKVSNIFFSEFLSKTLPFDGTLSKIKEEHFEWSNLF